MQRQLSGQQINCEPKESKRTCILDIATFPAHSSVVDMIPNQNTGTKETIMSLIIYFKNFWFAYDIFQNAHLTWTCLQSCPLAGSCIRRKVIGHLRETLMAVCSTPSSPLSVAFPVDAATLLKFLLTLKRKEGGKMFKAQRLIIIRTLWCGLWESGLYPWWCSALQAAASSLGDPAGRSGLTACAPAAAQTGATVEGNVVVTITNILLRCTSYKCLQVNSCSSLIPTHSHFVPIYLHFIAIKKPFHAQQFYFPCS